MLSPAERIRMERSPARRGFRSYIVLPADNEQVEIEINGQKILTKTDRGGYVDQEIVLHEPLSPGWHTINFTATRSGATEEAGLLVVDPAAKIGVISDIDDTAIITAVPQIAVAVWNTFIQRTTNRLPVAGMPAFFKAITTEYPNAPVVYLSNGAWNSARNIGRFLKRFGFPRGPLFLTDFGPTDTGFFRSGKLHKRTQIRWLMKTFPEIGWILIGDDGQSDGEIYTEAAHEYPERVAAIGIRALTPIQRMFWLTGTRPAQIGARDDLDSLDVPYIEAPDGDTLLAEFQSLGLLASVSN
jgi:phosphatidate phosphatase APP1